MNAPLKKIAAGAALAATASVLWGLVEPYIVDVNRYDVELPNLPEEWRGKKIAVLGDMQLGMWMANVGTIRRAVRTVVREQPAAALLLGDFIYMISDPDDETIEQAVDLVRPLVEAGIPTYTVLGNHDYHMGVKLSEPNDEVVDALRNRLEEVGIRVLDNDVVTIEAPDGGAALYLAGIGSHYAQRDRAEETVARVPEGAARVVLMHHPDTFGDLPAGSAPLAIAGHTHGGQFRPPFNRQWSLMNAIQDDKVYTEGWIEDAGAADNKLYVNRGLGFSLLPLRVNAPPEVTFFTLW